MAAWVPYSQRDAWEDVTPVPQNDGPHPVVPIAYSPKFRETMDYFRAIVQSGEVSERALEITADAIEMNPANYTAWYYRRKCLEALGTELHQEMRLTARHALETPKNYQIWYHRRWLVEQLGDASSEKLLTERAIAEDSKNYHAQWAVEKFGLWEGELEFTVDLLEADVRNNSAWNHRWFVIERTEKFTDKVCRREVDFALARLCTAPRNDSPCNYIRGMTDLHSFGALSQIKTALLELRAGSEGAALAPQPAALLADALAEEAQAGNEEARRDACKLYAQLATELDRVRAKYWQYLAAQLAEAGAAAGVGAPPDVGASS